MPKSRLFILIDSNSQSLERSIGCYAFKFIQFSQALNRLFLFNSKEDLANLPKAGICINATSLGLKPNDPLPIDINYLSPEWAVYDMVYNPQATQLFIEAQKYGCAVKTGLGMLVHQGAKALEIWTGKEVDAQVMQ